jgi:sigma-E factor negative regulatory protein RseB
MIPQRSTRKFLIGLLMLTAGPVWAENGPHEIEAWFNRMSEAVERLSYRGTLIQVEGERIESFRVIRRVDDLGSRERVFALNGPLRETIRMGDHVRSSADGRPSVWMPSVIQPKLMWQQSTQRSVDVVQAYDVRLEGVERVAGYWAQRIDLVPKDGFRYGQRLWLERDTGMLLKSVIFNRDGQRLSEQGFVQIELGIRISDADLEPTAPAVAILEKSVEAQSGGVGRGNSPMVGRMLRPLWAPKQVPAFFHLVNAHHGRSEVNSAFDHLLFSDGLSSFSVYIDHSPTQAIDARMHSLGALHVFTGMMGQRQFTVMGQVPQETVEFVGRQFLRQSMAETKQ